MTKTTAAKRADRRPRVESPISQKIAGFAAGAEPEAPGEFIIGTLKYLHAQYKQTKAVAEAAYGFNSRFGATKNTIEDRCHIETFAELTHWMHLEAEKLLIMAVMAVNRKFEVIYPNFEKLPTDWTACDVMLNDVRFIVFPNPDEIGSRDGTPSPCLVMAFP